MKYNPILCDLISLLVIQKLIHLEQHRNPSPKHRKPKHLHNKENCNPRWLMCGYGVSFRVFICYVCECDDNNGYRRQHTSAQHNFSLEDVCMVH